MATSEGAFEPAELLGDHYHSIGGSYASLDRAIAAVKDHNRNKHGGGGSFRVYTSPAAHRSPTIVEVGLDDGNPLRIQSLYKVFEGPPGS
jgi:hypothetical protein